MRKICMSPGTKFPIMKEEEEEWKNTIIETVNAKAAGGKLKFLWPDGQLIIALWEHSKTKLQWCWCFGLQKTKKPSLRTSQDIIAEIDLPPATPLYLPILRRAVLSSRTLGATSISSPLNMISTP